MIYFTGFADEAASGIAGQIAATKALGWSNIESRNIDGKNIHDLDEAAFEKAAAALEEAGVKINCFGSAVANWAVNPFDDQAFTATKSSLVRALTRMDKLGCRMLRGMSFAMQKQLPPDDPAVEAQVFPKLRELVKMCADSGVIYLHENCMNYGGQSPQHTLRLLEKIAMPNFKLVFDTGNPVFTDLRQGKPPYVKQRSYDFFRAVREHIAYIHIKDGVFKRDTDGVFPDAVFTYPGEGNGDVAHILNELAASGYDGGISIEPHLAVVFHDADAKAGDELRFNSYVEYGRRLMKLAENARRLADGNYSV